MLSSISPATLSLLCGTHIDRNLLSRFRWTSNRCPSLSKNVLSMHASVKISVNWGVLGAWAAKRFL